MRYAIEFSPRAARDYKDLDARLRGGVRDAIETHLRHHPAKTSKSRIKRLRGLSRPQYRLRAGDIRVVYDLTETMVQVLAIVEKSNANEWLERCGEKS